MKRPSRAARGCLLLALAGALFVCPAPSTAAAQPRGMLRIQPLGGVVPVPIPQPFANTAHAHLTYYGGPIMAFTDNAIVLWGATGHSSTLTSGLPDFFSSFANAGNANTYDTALEYETQGLAGDQPLTLATRYLGSFTIAPSTTSTNLTDAQVVAELIAQIASGALPPPRVAFNGPVTVYYVMFPPTYRICLGTDCSNTQFCAYHSNAAYIGTPFTYTVLPESTPTNSGCGASSAGGGFGNLTSMTSHELVESVTDPEVGSASAFVSPLAWYDQSNGEVADICNGQQATLTLDTSTWTVQKQWSNAEAACIVSQTSSSGFAPAVAHAYATPGTRVVTLIVTDAAGASGAKFLNVTTQNFSVSSAGNGQITSVPAGLVCGGSCSANFLDEDTVSLTATANPGAAFAGWTGDCAGQPATCIVTMAAARTATAIFISASPPAPPPTPAASPPPPALSPVVCLVPPIRGRPLAAARTTLQEAHCSAGAITRRFSRVARGRVISQAMAPGKQLANGASVNLVVSKGRAPFRLTLCYRHRTVHVTRAVAIKLRRLGAKLGACGRR